MSKAPSKAELEALADRALEAKLIADEAAEQAADAKSALEAALEAAGKLNQDMKALGHAKLNISKNRYFDVEVASVMLTKKTLKECMVTKLDPKLVKQQLTPAQTEAAMKSHARPWKVGIDVLKD